MKVKIKNRIVYTTNQIDRKILEVGEHNIEKSVYEILKNNQDLEVINEDKDITKQPEIVIEKNVEDDKIENNTIEIKDETEVVSNGFSKKNKKLKN